MRCETCSSETPDTADTCPFCQTPVHAGRLGRADDTASSGWLTRAVDDRLARSAVESLLTRHESLGELIRDDALAGPLSASELRAAAQKSAGEGEQGLDELDRMMPAEMVRMDLDGLMLAGLVDKKAGDLAVLKTGLVLLRAGRYAEAAEWWSLKRESLGPEQARLELLLLLMEMFTYVLEGRTDDAARVRSLVREHALFDRYRGDRAGQR